MWTKIRLFSHLTSTLHTPFYNAYIMIFVTPVRVSRSKKEYFCGMYVLRKKNRSGSTSIAIVDKSSGKYRYLTTTGISSDEQELTKLYRQGKKRISVQRGDRDMFTLYEQKREE
jgi:hypothetical protein